MRSRVAVALVVLGCSSHHAHSPADAATAADATSDTAPDAMPCTGPDADHDGVCDAVDDCPDVFDPGQPDLDGDGIGWVCDPVESITVPVASGSASYASVEVVGSTLASVFNLDCSGSACTHEIVAAAPSGKLVARSDSGLPRDAWLSDGGAVYPHISADERIWSTRILDRDTGLLHVPDGTFTPVKSAATLRAYGPAMSYALGGPAWVLGLGPIMPINNPYLTDLVAPEGDALVPLATSADYFLDSNNVDLQVSQQPSVVAVPVRSGPSTAYTFGLSGYVPGSAALSPVAIGGSSATDLDYLGLMTKSPTMADFPAVPYCARRGSTYYYVGVSAAGPVSLALPFAYCPTVRGSSISSDTIFLLGQLADGNFTLLGIRGSQMFTVFNDLASTYNLDTYDGDHLLAVTFQTGGSGTSPGVWAVTSSGTSVLLTSTLQNVQVSAVGDTVQVAGVQPTTNGSGNIVLIRYREATGAQQITIETNVAAFQMVSLATTPEGGAIVGGYGNVYAVASNATTPVALGLSPFLLQAAARGSSTFVLAQTLAPSSQPALYAYDEMGGQPRLTRLTPDTRDMQAFPIDAPKGPRSAWFAYGADATCNLARIIYSNGAPTIDQIACAAINDVSRVGATSNGTVIAMDADDGVPSASHIYALTANGGAEVAHFPTQPTLLEDHATVDTPIVGWYGTDAMGTVACLANSPDRCWTIGGTSLPISVSAGSMGTEDSFAIEGVTRTASSVTATIVRTLGPGDRVPPLL